MTPILRDRIDHPMAWRGCDLSKEDISFDGFVTGYRARIESQDSPRVMPLRTASCHCAVASV